LAELKEIFKITESPELT